MILLVRVEIAGVLDEVRADPAVVQQRVAFCGCAVAHDALAVALERNEELEDLALFGRDALSVGAVGVQVGQARLLLAREELRHALGVRVGRVGVVAAEDPQRTAVCGQFLDVEHSQPVGGKKPAGR